MPFRGGWRQGAGRPVGSKSPSTILAMEMRKEIIETVRKELEPLLVALVDSAKGHRIKSKKGRIYSKSPDLRSIVYLLDQALGRPRTAEEMTIENEPALGLDTKKATIEEIDAALKQLIGM